MKSTISALLFVVISIAIPFFFHDIMKIIVTKMSTNWVFATFYIRLLSVIFFTIGLYLFLQNFKKTRKLKFIWVFLIALGPGFGISLIEPIYQSDYGICADDLKIEDIEKVELQSNYKFNKEYNLLVFGTTSCPHCKAIVRKLALNVDAGQNLRVSTFFSGTEEDAIQYLKENNGSQFDHHIIEDDSTFLSFSGNTFPSTFLIQPDGTTLHHWTGDMINYSALDLLVELSE